MMRRMIGVFGIVIVLGTLAACSVEAPQNQTTTATSVPAAEQAAKAAAEAQAKKQADEKKAAEDLADRIRQVRLYLGLEKTQTESSESGEKKPAQEDVVCDAYMAPGEVNMAL